MSVALIVVGAAVLVALLLLAMTRRQDHQAAIGVLSRETLRRDRSETGLESLTDEGVALPSAREVEQAALARRSGTGQSVAVMTETRPVVAPPRYVDDETLGVTRRQFLNRGILGLFGLSLAGFGAACLGFLWPTLSGGFGAKISAGKINDILSQIAQKKTPVYVPAARTYLNPYPAEDLKKAKKSGAYADPIIAGMEKGLVALYQKCPHLGCRVPWCQSSQWFECPCHGSQYNRVGEKKGGPAPRGMDRFAFSVGADGTVTVDTKTVYLGPPIGTNTTGQEAEGPHCR